MFLQAVNYVRRVFVLIAIILFYENENYPFLADSYSELQQDEIRCSYV